VMVTTFLPTVLQNQAILAQDGGWTCTATTSVLVDPSQLYLPLVSRNES
jgi:hypothetical protein